MYQNQMQPQLPFDPQQMQQQPLPLSLNNPPFIPQVQTHPQLQQMVPLIAAACAMEIQSKAGLNPLRMFMYNRYRLNNFANVDFEALVGNVVDYVAQNCYVQQTYRDLEQATNAAVPMVVEMVCGMAVNEFPALQGYCPPDMLAKVQISNQNFRQIGAEIQAGRPYLANQIQQLMQRQAPQAMQGGGWVQAYQQDQPQQNTYRYPPNGMQQRPGPSMVGGLAGSPTPSGMFNRQPSREPVGMTSQVDDATPNRFAAMADRYKLPETAQASQQAQQILHQPYKRPAFEEASQQMQTPEPIPQPTIPAGETLVAYEPGSWSPDPRWPSWYLPAYNPHTHGLFIKVKSDGTVIPVVQELEIMEYEKHRVKTIFGPITLGAASKPDFMPTLDAKLDVVTTLPDSEEGDSYNPVHLISQKIIADNCEPSMWYVMYREYFSQDIAKGLPDVYTREFQLYEPMLSLTNDTAAIEQLAEQSNYGDLRKTALELYARGEMSAQMFGAVRARMTSLINRQLNQNLGIPHLGIQSFMDMGRDDGGDYQDLLEFLEKNYGNSVLNAFLKNQKTSIANVFKTPSEEILESYRDMPDDASPDLHYSCLSSSVTATLINCSSSELEIELFEGMGAVLTTNFTPVMLKIVKRIFDHVADHDDFARHLIRTTDGVVLEATRGYLASDSYILTRVE